MQRMRRKHRDVQVGWGNQPLPLVVAFLLLLTFLLITVAPALAAPPPAGFIINNRAEVTYIPFGHYLPETISSNTVSAEVEAVESLLLTPDWTVNRPPGALITLPHLLTNTGNIDSTYTFTLTNLTGDGYDLTNLQLIHDLNNNGIADPGEPLITLDAPAFSLAPGEAAGLLVRGLVPAGAGTTSAQLRLTATTTGTASLSATNIDTIQCGDNAAVILSKKANKTGTVFADETIHYQLVATNIGDLPATPTATAALNATPILINGTPATVFLIRDLIPVSTTYVPGSLITSLPNTVKLFRLPGDPLFSYRTNGDDMAAIEVAAASTTFSLNPNVTTDMRFAVRVKTGFSGTINNTGDAYFADGGESTESPSNQVVLEVPLERIGLAKRAGVPVYENNPATGLLLGTALVRMSFVVESFSSYPLYHVQLRDLLTGAERFGTYTSNAQPGSGEYTIASPAEMTWLRDNVTVAFNSAYDGTSAHADLLAADVTLPPRGAFEVSFVLRVNATGIDGLRYNTGTVSATLGNPAYGSISDDSVNGSTPDKNGDGNPTNDSSPTPVLLSLPDIKVIKTADEPRKVAGANGTWEVDYTLTVTNSGKGVAPYINLSDNLNCTFQSYETPAPVLSWELVGTPTAENGLLQINPTYTGAASCTAAVAENDNPYLGMQRDPSILLTDGTRHLNPGASEVLHYTVRFVTNPLAKAEDRLFTNRVYAGSFDRPDAGSGLLQVAAESAAAIIPLDPSGIVYNSATRQPVAGAEVTLTRLSCTGGGSGPITPAEILPITGVDYSYSAGGSVSMTTAADGAYTFFLLSPPVTDSCEYSLLVTPPVGSNFIWPSSLLPPSSGAAPGGAIQIQETAPAAGDPTHYYLLVNLGPTLPIVIHNHIPLDPTGATASLVLEKSGNKEVIEIGSNLIYTLKLKNATGGTRTGFKIVDNLPVGFRFVAGSAHLNGVSIADPAGAPGLELTFHLSDLILENSAEATISYWVQAGIGTQLGDAVNRATTYSGKAFSNQAAWKVRVEGGVFSEEAFLFGKVFMDCNEDGIQGHEEVGIPGIRLIMEDGTGVVTDVEGKYSLYSLRAITHVLKLDTTTLPPGAQLEVIDNRNSGRGDSRFVDLKKGELHKANFAVKNCSDPVVVDEVERRRRALAERPDAEGEAVSRTRLTLQPVTEPNLQEMRGRAAAGAVSLSGIEPFPTATVPQPSPAVFQPVMPRDLTGPSSLPTSPLATLPRIELESLLLDSDNALAFLDLKDGDTLPIALANVRVKGRLGSTLRLTANNAVLAENRVGKRARLSGRELEAWEYIGVELKPGRNTLLLEEIDPFGITRGRQEISLTAPGSIGRIEIEAPETAVADGATPVLIKVRLTDDRGIPVTVRSQLTLEIDNGRWEMKDLNPDEPGTQIFIQGGSADFTIIPPNQPLDALVRVSSGILQKEVKIAYLPELRPLIGAGILEGVLDLSHRGQLPLTHSSGSAFEQSLRNLSRESDSGRSGAAGRAAFFFKGAIKGEYLLTAAFDSDKETGERLFRDIQPDKYYPVYGDSSAKIFDAQSSGRLYVRIDKQKSWLLFGDFTTDDGENIRQLSKYSRSVTGLKEHFENSRLSANVYLNNDDLQRVEIEIPANGTSGPYQLSAAGELYENSEQVQILVRDRNQPSIILQTIPMTRFTDYTIEPLSKRLLFAGPVASLDENLNPRSIRVTYEVSSGGPSFWMGGADAQLKLTEQIQVGASYVRDENPDNMTTLTGGTVVLRIAERSVVTTEIAQSQTDLSGTGTAGRIEWLKDSGDLKVRAQATTADTSFDNSSSGFSAGRTEATINSTYQVNPATAIRAEGIYSQDQITDGERKGVLAAVSTRLGENSDSEIGVRASRDTTVAAESTSPGATPNSLLSVRGRLGRSFPGVQGAKAYLEVEQDVRESQKRMAAVGGDYQINDKTRLYGRYEFISSLGGPFDLNNVQENNTAVVGIESAYLQDGRIFNEFRMRDTISGRESEAASGVRKTWLVADGLRLGGSFERTTAFSGTSGNDATAVTSSLEYSGNQRYRLYGSLETRFAETGDSYLNTVGIAYKLNKSWSLLSRSAYSLQKSDSGDTTLSRQQIGLAWRQVDLDRWNALGRYEYLLKREPEANTSSTSAAGREETHIISLHVNYQPIRTLIASGRYAFKWGREEYADLDNDFRAHLLFGRITKDLTKRVDASLLGAYTWDQTGAAKYALGAEIGFMIIPDLWLSVGKILSGFRDDELTNGEYTNQGTYLRLRFKFDEGLFK